MRRINIFSGLGGCFFIVILILFTSTKTKTIESITNYSISAAHIPSTLTFAGEEIPLIEKFR